MRILTLIFVSLIFFSCSKSTDPADLRLLRTESKNYNGNMLYTEYGYDNQGRITTITQHENNEQPAVAVTISYNGNEATLLSYPDFEPMANETKQVRLTLGAGGRMVKRIEYYHEVPKATAIQTSEKFRYDTLVCEYDATGLLKKTTTSSYDSASLNLTFNIVSRSTTSASYNTVSGNLVSQDEYAVYPIITRNGSITTISGGSTERHNVFKYTKAFANNTDFKNAAVLNEYQQYYEPWLNSNYKNMTEQAIRNTIDKDINGSVIFTITTTIDIERTYNTEGLLSAVNIVPGTTQYIAINYFYGK